MSIRLSMKSNVLKIRFLLALTAVFGAASIYVLADLTPAQVEKGKNATAAVCLEKPAPGKRVHVDGTAFCIDAAGWFITCRHVIDKAANNKVGLILNSGEKDQRIVEAKIIRSSDKWIALTPTEIRGIRGRNKEIDLAVLKVDEPGPFVALSFGKVEDLTETARLTAFGYPLGESLALTKDVYPSITVSPGDLNTLRTKEGKIEEIQLNASINPGNSGGPVLDSDGRVIGIVQAEISNTAIKFAIPVSRLQEFLSEPDAEFIEPVLTAENVSKPAAFKVDLLTIMNGNADYRAEMTLTTAIDHRTIPMKRGPEGFSAEAVPVLPQNGRPYVSLSAKYGQNSVSGMMVDRSFTVAGRTYQLSRVQRLEGGTRPGVVMDDGKKVEGTINGLSSVAVFLDETQVNLNLAKASSVMLYPIAPSAKVEYAVAITRDGKPIKTISGNIHIAGMALPGTNGPDIKIIPAPLNMSEMEVALPSEIADVTVGGGGRFLILHLRKLRKLAIFDVSAAKVVKYLPVDSDIVRIAAGANKLIVVSALQNFISRYSLTTFEREAIVPIPFTGVAKAIAMGSNSNGPLLMEFTKMATIPPARIMLSLLPSSGTYFLFDPNTMALKDELLQAKIHSAGGSIRASADGTVFSLWGSQSSDLQTLNLAGNDAKTYESFTGGQAGRGIPSPDGRIIYTQDGLYTAEAIMIGSRDSYAKASLRLPATRGDYYLEIDQTGRIAVCHAGEPRALVTLPGLGGIGVMDNKLKLPSRNAAENPPKPRSIYVETGFYALDKHIYFIPDAHVIVAIPETNDRLILRQFDLQQALKTAGIDYLFVASSPVTTVAPQSFYTYQIQIESKREGVKFSLEKGPAGMQITPAGKLTWTAGAAENKEIVIIRITDASGQEIFHTFTINVK
jgi:S1-C subfamily serine protease